ncbi:hypothetical protein CCAX7_37300 [Capsulimonas corticalis]|uniref:Uncharacterized protein n=1 Tax=Capsulimonas corticalis TaxID=2219043 RepID=A0A402D130_9BACT|nr:hypothetical protein [Capsulimonas corticalis]BDI31679.1 hypothetical protein CCAX7_37300 [Capsulimonas corticalis]
MQRSYRYIGSEDLANFRSERQCVLQPQDVLSWIGKTAQRLENHTIVATFVIDVAGALWIADRRSEHVACAAGRRVLSAGEMTFAVDHKDVSVTEVTNQSLGYCPEPESWPAVADALARAGIPSPTGFTCAYTIRLCETCGTKNIIKDGVYECGVCESVLSAEWNLDPSRT